MAEIEIITVKHISKLGSLLGVIDIIPDPSIRNGYKKTLDNRIFVSFMNYNDLKQFENAKSIINALQFLIELL